MTRGILEAHRAGVVSAASMFANAPGFGVAVHGARGAPGLELGLHFNLTAGRSLTEPAGVASLCGPHGGFLSFAALCRRALMGRIDPDHVARECGAQLERLRAHGLTVTHLDGHRHAHCLPGVWPAVARIGAREGIPVRVPVEPLRGGRAIAKLALRWLCRDRDHSASPPRHFRGIGLLGAARFGDLFVQTLDELPGGGTEVMVHPGYVDADLRRWDRYGEERERELAALRSPQVLTRLRRGDLRVVRFADL